MDHFSLIFLQFKRLVINTRAQLPFLESFKSITNWCQFLLPRKAGPDSLSREEDKTLLIRPWLPSTLPTSIFWAIFLLLTCNLCSEVPSSTEKRISFSQKILWARPALLVAPCDHSRSSHLFFSSLSYFSHFGHSEFIFAGRKTIVQGLRKWCDTISDKNRRRKRWQDNVSY